MKPKFILLKGAKGNRFVRIDLIAMIDDANTMDQDERWFQKMKEFHGNFNTIISIENNLTENVPQFGENAPRMITRNYEKFYSTNTVEEIFERINNGKTV